MNFHIQGLDSQPFTPLFGLSEQELAQRNIERVRVDSRPGAPCRISLDDADIGESVLLLSYIHQPAGTPYHQQGPIFVREGAKRFDALNAIPPAMLRRQLSLRGFDVGHAMIEAEVVDGVAAAAMITRFFETPQVAYIHAHYARRGCFAASIARA